MMTPAFAGPVLRGCAPRFWTLALACVLFSPSNTAFAAPVFAPNAAEYLLIGTGPQSIIGTSTAVSNFELGRMSEPVPMSGLTLPPNPPGPIPAGAQIPTVGIGGNGDIANTHFDGNFDLSNMDVWGNSGIDCQGPLSSCNTGLSNTNFNGAPMTTSNGLNGSVDLSPVKDELDAARAMLPSLVGDQNIDITLPDGKWGEQDTVVINLLSGTTVFDFVTDGGKNIELINSHLLINGPADALAIFRLPDDGNFNVTQSTMLVGTGGIGLNNVLFYTDRPGDNGQHVNVNNLVVNGIAFWDLNMDGDEVTFNDVQGCTQVVADKINLNDVRLTNCHAGAIPEPGTGVMLGIGLVGLGMVSAAGRRQRR